MSTGPLHLQAAGAARPTAAVVEAQVAHLRREHELGGYPAEEAVAPVLAALHDDLRTLMGGPDQVHLVDSAGRALDELLHARPAAWTRVGVAPSEWGPNLEAFRAHGLAPTTLDVDDHGRLDLDRLERRLRADPPDLLHVVHAASHRALLQPVAAVVDLAARHGVPVWVDAAQALGHHDVAYPAAAVYAPGRKWLRGPRGTGVLALRGAQPAPRPPADPDVVGRVGLAAAVAEHLAAGPATRRARLHERGAVLRDAVTGLPGWRLVDEPAAVGAIVGLVAEGPDVEETYARLRRDHGVVTTACLPWRAPGEMTAPVLRLAPHVDLRDDDVERVVAALGAGSSHS